MPADRLQQTLDTFSDASLQREAGKTSGLVGAGQAVQAVASTLKQIKVQKDETRAQGILDNARAKKAELDLLLADKSAQEQEELMASSRYRDAYQGFLDSSAAITGPLGENLRTQIGQIQTKTKLGHLTNLAKQIGTERKERVKDVLGRYKARVATDPSKKDSAALDAHASVQMFMRTPGQRNAFEKALNREKVLGHLDAFTNNGPHHDPEQAKKLLDNPDVGNYLSADEVRRYRKYITAPAGSDKSTTARNSIISGAIDLKDFRYLRNAQGDPNLSAPHKKQLDRLNGHIRSLASKNEVPTAENMNKLLITNPKDKGDRDWNKQVQAVGNALGELYAKNPRDYMSAVMGPEFEADLGHGDAVSAELGSRVTSAEAAKITLEGEQALMDGSFDAWNKETDVKYGDSATALKQEAVNRAYHGKTDFKSRATAAALRLELNPMTKQMFPQDLVQKALSQKGLVPDTSYVPAYIERLDGAMPKEMFKDVVATAQLIAAYQTSQEDLGATTGADYKLKRKQMYDTKMDEQNQLLQSSTIDMQVDRPWWPDWDNGLLEDDKPAVITPAVAGSLTRVQLIDNKNAVKEQLNVTNIARYGQNFDEATNELLEGNEGAPVFLEPDPTSSGDRFLVGVSVPTGRTAVEGWFFDDAEMRTQHLRMSDGQLYKVSLKDVYGQGRLFPESLKSTPGPKGLAQKALEWFRSKGVEAAASVISPAPEQTEPVDTSFIPDKLTPQQEEEIQPLQNLPAVQQQAYQTQFKQPIANVAASKFTGAASEIPQAKREQVLTAIGVIETQLGTTAYRRDAAGRHTSKAGAQGPFQLMPVVSGASREFGAAIDPFNVEQAAGRAAQLFVKNFNRSKRLKVKGATTEDHIIQALRMYNGIGYGTKETLMKIVQNKHSTGSAENNKYIDQYLRLIGSKRVFK